MKRKGSICLFVGLLLACAFVANRGEKRKVEKAKEDAPASEPEPDIPRTEDSNEPLFPGNPTNLSPGEMIRGTFWHGVAQKLHQIFESPEEITRIVFSGKTIAILGVVTKLDRDRHGRGVIILTVGQKRSERMYCFFDTTHSADFEQVRSTDSVCLVARCTGKRDGFIVLEKCRLALRGDDAEDLVRRLKKLAEDDPG